MSAHATDIGTPKPLTSPYTSMKAGSAGGAQTRRKPPRQAGSRRPFGLLLPDIAARLQDPGDLDVVAHRLGGPVAGHIAGQALEARIAPPLALPLGGAPGRP